MSKVLKNCLLGTSLMFFFHLSGQDLPEGFILEEFVSGLYQPTAMKFTDDGRLFICEKSGKVKIVENGQLLEQDFVEVETETPGERGLNGIAFDPDFAVNQYVYLYHTLLDSNLNQIIRLKDAGNFALPNSEELVFKFDKMWAAWHNGGAMLFDDLGKLIVAMGDGTAWTESPNLNSTLGKIYRINSDGTIPNDNPFLSQLEGKHRGLYSYGVRNPFSLAKSNMSGRIFFNDVGGNSYEEINELEGGKNYGWNLIEGPLLGQTPPDDYKDPIHFYEHDEGCAIVGACFYEPENSNFPLDYYGKYFFMDYCEGWIKYLDPLSLEVNYFGEFQQNPVAIEHDANGNLYFLNFALGKIFKLSYLGQSQPVFFVEPESTVAVPGESIEFLASAISNSELNYTWYVNSEYFSEGSNSISIQNVQIENDGDLFFCVAENEFGSDTSAVAILNVIEGTRPTIQISSNINSAYSAGDTLKFNSVILDNEDGTVPVQNTKWWIDFHHGAHTHPAVDEVSGSSDGEYIIPKSGETSTDVWYRINLEAFDSDGLITQSYLDIFPLISTINISSEPIDIFLSADGQTIEIPTEIQSVDGLNRTFQAPDYIVQSDRLYRFDSWDENSNEPLLTFSASDTSILVSFIEEHEYIEGLAGPNPSVTYYSGVGSNKEIYRESFVNDINENWTVHSPFRWEAEFPVDSFSVRYRGSILAPYTGQYQFIILHDNYVKFCLEDSLCIENQHPVLSIANSSISTQLQAGEYYNFDLLYEHYKDFSRLGFKWAFSFIENQIIPEKQLFPENFETTSLIKENDLF
ncbi:MAG: PQQ-dependent sugar dehydrogenase, partial [Bacteroidota bacterium]